MEWIPFIGSSSDWDSLMYELGSTSHFSYAGIASSRSGGKWNVTRLVDLKDDRPVAAAQVLTVNLFGLLTLCWVPGGPCSATTIDARRFLRSLSDHFGSRFVYCRFSLHQTYDEVSADSLRRHGWHQSRSTIGAKETFIIERSGAVLADTTRLSANWRRNLRRGLHQENIVSFWSEPNAIEIHKLYDQLAEYKRSQGPAGIPSIDYLNRLFANNRNNLVCVQVRNPEGILIAMRAAIVSGSSAWDLLAAANESGRKSYASYVCAWKLIELLDQQGVDHFDLAGIDQVENEGVFNFKKGLGGTRIQYLGEWEASRPYFLRFMTGLLISRLR